MGTDLSLLADDGDKRKCMDALEEAYAHDRLDMTEFTRRQDLVYAPNVRRRALVEALDGLGTSLYPESEPKSLANEWAFVIGVTILLLIGILVLVVLV